MSFLDQARKLLTNFGQRAFNATPVGQTYNLIQNRNKIGQEYNKIASQPISKPLQSVNKVLGNVRQTAPAQFGAGLISGGNWGMAGSPAPAPKTKLQQRAFTAGSVIGAFNPQGLLSKGLFKVGMGTQGLIGSKLAGTVAPNLLKKVLPVVGGEVAQTGAMLGLKKGIGQEFNPITDLAFGLGTRGLLGAGRATQTLKFGKLYREDINNVKDALKYFSSKDFRNKPDLNKLIRFEKDADVYLKKFKLFTKEDMNVWKQMDLPEKYRLISQKMQDLYTDTGQILGVVEKQGLQPTGGGGSTYPKASVGLTAGQTNRKLVPSVAPATIPPLKKTPPIEAPITTGGGQSNIPPSSSSKPIIPQDPVQKITQALKEAKPIRGEQEAMYTKARAQRVAAASAMGQKIPGEQGYYAQLGQLKGEMPKAQFEGIRNKLTPEDINSVFQKVEDVPYFSTFEKITAKTGLAKLLGKEGGVVPNKSELSLLNEIFPPEFIKAAQGNRTLLQKIWSGVGQVAAVPRSLMAGGLDMSYGLRQGVFSGYRHPKQWASAFKEQFKYFGSDKAVQKLNESIKAHPNYKLSREAGVSLTDLGAGRLNPREEQFQSALAEKIPIIGKLVKASGRAYTGFANKYRFDMFNDLIAQAKKTGDFDDPKFLKSAGELVNTLTGRGSLGKFEKQAGVLSSTLFSPRLLASRLQLMNPQFYMKLQPAARKRALESLVAYVAGTATILGAAKLAGAEVGTDMTNSDFAKIKVGNTRVDVMGGFQQPLVLLARLLTNKVTSSTTGKTMTLGEGYKAMTRFDMIQRFFESKEAPIVSFITSAIKGQDTIGKPFNFSSEVIDRMVPMFIADLVDLYKDGGLSSLPLGIPGFFGAGSQTYGKTELVSGKNQLGEPTSQVRPIQGLGESVTEKVFGQQPLGSSSNTNVNAYYDQMLKMPKDDANRQFQEITKSNPELAKKIVVVAKERKMGITVEDQVLRAKGVASGDRAVAIAKEFDKLKTKEEKNALWQEYIKKKIITKEVAKQLIPLLKK